LIKHRNIQYVLSGIFTILFAYLNITKMYFLFENGNNQIQHAKRVAESMNTYIKKQPIQTVALPSFENDSHYRYFIELNGYDILSAESSEQPEELYVICQKECNPTGDGQWQIAAFTDKLLTSQWQIDDVTIYKIIHKNMHP